MDTQDRTEVREMIHATLEGWEKATVAREIMTLKTLDKIEKHLDRMNGSIALHEKIINTNLPHNIALCPQAETIKEIRDVVIGEKAVSNTDKQRYFSVLKTIGVIIVVLTFAFGIFRNNKKTDTIITNEAANKEMNDSIRKAEIQKIKAEARGILIPVDSKPFVLDTVRVDSIINSYLKR
jgi:hypothetical protein